jgi:hypothetical protein
MAVAVLPEDVAAGWRPLTEAEVIAATGLITEAQIILGATITDLDSKSGDLVKLVIAKMVRRVLKNPEGFRIKDMGIDDYREGGTVDSSLSTGELYVAAEELLWLGVRPVGRAFEIRLGGS